MTEKDISKIKAQVALIENGLAENLEQAKSMLSCGLVFIGDKKLDNKSLISKEDISSGKLRVKYSRQYVSRGAVKLETVFNGYDLNVKDMVCADIGASTGGFTQLLLEKGASFVFAVDVGKGILDYKLRIDKRVMVLEEINARLFNTYDIINSNIQKHSLDLAVFDLSFISLKMVVPAVLPYIKKGGYVIPMVKPQFELPKEQIGKGGIIKDEEVIKILLAEFRSFFESNSLEVLSVLPSGLRGTMGNLEYFYVMKKY